MGPVRHSKMAEATPEVEDTGPAARELVHLRAAALLPDQLLQGGEVIVLLIKPSPWYIVVEPLGFLSAALLALIIAVVLTAKGYQNVAPIDLVVLAAIGVVAVRLMWQLLEWLGRVYVLTDRRLVVVSGVLRVQVFETQLKNIQHTMLQFALRERLLGLGTVAFATAGTGFIETAWRMIARPLEVHRIVVQALDRYR